MPESTAAFTKKPVRRRTPVKNVVLSAEAKKAYEQMVEQRDERDRDYSRHLAVTEKLR
jgi:hypothetical protein